MTSQLPKTDRSTLYEQDFCLWIDRSSFKMEELLDSDRFFA